MGSVSSKEASGSGQRDTSNAEDTFASSLHDTFTKPMRRRSCTDVLFLLIFLAYLGGMGYTCYLAYTLGDPYRLVHGQDSWGNACNQKNNRPVDGVALSGKDTSALPRAFYFNPLAIVRKDKYSTVLCVARCPKGNINTVTDLQKYVTNSGIHLCRYDIGIQDFINGSTISSECPSMPLEPQVNVLNRCMPESLIKSGSILTELLGKTIQSLLDLIEAQCEKEDFFDSVVSDIDRSWQKIVFLCIIALGLALTITFLMRFIACVIIWTLVFGFVLGSLGATAYCWYRYYLYRRDYDSPDREKWTQEQGEQMRTWLIIAISVTVGSTIIILILLVLRTRIALVVQLFREAGKAIAKMPFMLLLPFFSLIFLLGSLSALVYLFLFIYTAGDPVVQPNGHVKYVEDKILKYMKWYYIVGVLWIIQFVIACHFMVVAGAVARWYFTRDKSQLDWPILTSKCRLVVYHLGSVALGSLIIALVQVARLVLAFVHKRLYGHTGVIVETLQKCLHCCLWCFEKVLKFINRNAYIMIAIHGWNFWTSAKRGFVIVVANILRVSAINSVGAFTLFLGKVGIVVVTVVIGLEAFFKNDRELCHVWVPLLLAGLFAFLVADAFLSVYELAIDTIFLCFCEDSNMNNGIEKPYFMSKELMEYVVNSQKTLLELKNKSFLKQKSRNTSHQSNDDAHI